MKKELRNYKPLSYFTQHTGLKKSFFENLLKSGKIAYTRSSNGQRATRLICLNEWNRYLDQFRVESIDEAEILAHAIISSPNSAR